MRNVLHISFVNLCDKNLFQFVTIIIYVITSVLSHNRLDENKKKSLHDIMNLLLQAFYNYISSKGREH